MEPSTQKLLEEILKVSRENNRLLHKIHRTMRWGRILRMVYWLIIIGSMLGLLYYFQPFIDSVIETIKQFGANIDKVQGALDSLPGGGSQ